MRVMAIMLLMRPMLRSDSIRQLPEVHHRSPWRRPFRTARSAHLTKAKSPPAQGKSRVANSGAAFPVGDAKSGIPIARGVPAETGQALPGASFVVNGAAQVSDSTLTTASAEMKWTNGWAVATAYEGEFSDVTRDAGKGMVRYQW
jgi:hypothetical protein